MAEKRFIPELMLSVQGNPDSNCATFVVEGEGHTLGNAIRWALVKNPDVQFAGYTVPHPSEMKIHIRVQTKQGTTAKEALEKASTDVSDICDHMLVELDAACAAV